jgi:hypothetical protein
MYDLGQIFANPEAAPCPGGSCCSFSLVIDDEFIVRLETLVERLERKLTLRYFSKCVAYNQSIGGGNNFHAIGRAVDVDTLKMSLEPVWLARFAWQLGFNAIGVYGSNMCAGYKGKMGMVHLGWEEVSRFWGDWHP